MKKINIKKFNDWSLTLKISIPFLLIILVFLGNFFTIKYFIGNAKYNTTIVDIAARNSMLSQKIAYLAEIITRGNEDAQEELAEAVEYFDKSLKVLKEGGRAPDFILEIPPINEEVMPILFKVEDEWARYKDYAVKIYDAQYITQSIREIAGIDSTENFVKSTNTIEVINPEILDAVIYIEKNSEKILTVNNNLVKEFVNRKRNEQEALNYYLILLFFVNILIIIAGIIIGRKFIVTPIQKVESVANSMANGNLEQDITIAGNNEIGKIVTSINNLRKKLNDKVQFITEVTKGNYNATYTIESEDDIMGKSLLAMQKSFQEAALEEEKRKEEDKRQNWATQGLARFAEILRQDNDNIEKLSYNIIKYMVDVLEANQGGLFIINDNEKKDVHIELTAAVAFNKRKFLQKRIELGVGLIGRCVIEQQTIYLVEVPDDYIEITSGMGGSNPRSLLLVPLKLNEEVFGVVEIASFSKFESYQIEFVEKVAESIASTIASVKISVQTSVLLKESQQQAEKMAAQEEAMRQNLGELESAQEKARMQEEKLTSFTASVNHTLIRAEYETDGTLIYANTKFLHKLGYISNSEVEGRHISMFIDDKDDEWFKQMWEPLSKGGKHYEGTLKHKTKDGNDVWMIATYTAVRNAQGEAQKILFLAIDTTKQKIESLDHKGQIQALEISSIKAEFLANGKLVKTNELFLKLLNYKAVEIENSNVFDFVSRKDLPEFKAIWDNASKGVPFRGEIKLLTQDEHTKWLHATFAAVYNMYEEVDKIIMIGNDITEQKQMELKAAEQAKELKDQEVIMQANMEELKAAQEEMLAKQKMLEEANAKMKDDEAKLKNALQDARDKEKEVEYKTQQLVASEEELRQNLEELQATQDEMSRKQEELLAAKEKLEKNEYILKKAISESKKREDEIKRKNEEMLAAEEELTQNLEEMQAVQEAMEQKQNETEKINKKLKANETILKKAMEKARQNEQKLKEKNEEMLAAEEELRQNMEELKATQDEMSRKQNETEKINKKLKANETIMKRAMEKARQNEQKLKEKNEEMLAAEEELRQNMEEMQAVQEALAMKQKELEEIKEKEKERTQKQLATQQNLMKKKITEFMEKIKNLETELKAKQEEIDRLKKQ